MTARCRSGGEPCFLLLALAVIDDLGAILIIALFYSATLAISGLLIAALGLGALLLMQRLGVRVKLLYVAPAMVIWAGVYKAGVHPTIAGVVIGLLTPARAWLGRRGFVDGVLLQVEHLAQNATGSSPSHELAESLRLVNVARREAGPGGESVSVTTGVALGLIVGKPIGVLFASLLALRLRIGTLPPGIGVRQMLVLGVVAGVGFTMALFISQLAFTDTSLLAAAKLGVIVASGGAAVLGLLLGRLLLEPISPGAVGALAETATSTDG